MFGISMNSQERLESSSIVHTNSYCEFLSPSECEWNKENFSHFFFFSASFFFVCGGTITSKYLNGVELKKLFLKSEKYKRKKEKSLSFYIK
jgi:hypothetical protein